MKICIVSDSHDQRAFLHAAVEKACNLGANAILHCGDLVAAGTLSILNEFQLPVHLIHGNNMGDLYTLSKLANRANNMFNYHGQDAALNLAGKRIFMVHFPHYARAMATTGDWDIVCCGHDHKVNIESIDNIKNTKTILLNPGSVAGIDAKPSFIIADLNHMEFNAHQLD